MRTIGKLVSTIAATVIFANAGYEPIEILEPTGLDQIKEIIENDARLLKSLKRKDSLENIEKVIPSIDGMNALIKETIKARALANDGVLTTSDAKEINRYLVENYAQKWYELRGQSAEDDSTGYYMVRRRGLNSGTTILSYRALNVWGYIYDIGFKPYDEKKSCKLSNAAGGKSTSFSTVGYYLSEIMKKDIGSGELYNPDFKEVRGTTGTNLDSIVEIILNDSGLLNKVATGDIRTGAQSADKMNALIIEAIIAEGLANDGKLTTADIREINSYLVANHKDVWAMYHGDDENDEESGYHLVQNDGAYTRMFADNVINSVADGIYHLGFMTKNRHRLFNEDGNANKSFEKVAWWLDHILENDLASGKLSNPDYQEVVGTTGTTLDKIIPFIYNNEGLLHNVSMADIRAGARSANGMNTLIVEAIRETGVAADDYISADEVKELNQYLVTNYATQWAELHGDDAENGQESGFHRIQNDGARGTLHNKNVINNVADGIYHLGFATQDKYRLVNEDGKKNASFKSVSYWLNSSLQEDYAKGVFK